MGLSRCCLGRWCHCHSFQSLQPLYLRFLLTHLQENGRGRDTKPLSLPGQKWEMPPWTVARLWQQLPAVLTWDSWSTVRGHTRKPGHCQTQVLQPFPQLWNEISASIRCRTGFWLLLVQVVTISCPRPHRGLQAGPSSTPRCLQGGGGLRAPPSHLTSSLSAPPRQG